MVERGVYNWVYRKEETIVVRAATTIKVLPETHARLLKMAKEGDRTIGEVITTLVKKYDNERFWEGVSDDLARFQSDERAHQKYRDEFAEWDSMTTSSLAEEPPYFEGGEE